MGKIGSCKDEQSDYEERIRASMINKIKEARQNLALRIERMKGASPLGRLNQGFSYVQNEEGHTVKSTDDVKKDDMLKIYVTNGTICAKVTQTRKER